jgi:tRNA pseudouridine32 synthase/23S rRNA pseudouridine746 synthase
MTGLIYCDESLLVVNKPAGLLSVPGRGEDNCLSARVQQAFPDALVVHRLDMATSGLLIFARGDAMQRRLSAMFREHLVSKRYVAVVAGVLETDDGQIDLPIGADWPNRPRQKIDTTQGRHSLTRYRVLTRNAETTRLELEPVTGRTHQLRVHMMAAGHPIIGDTLYDGRTAERLMLHAHMLNFAHPLSAEPLSLQCEPPF